MSDKLRKFLEEQGVDVDQDQAAEAIEETRAGDILALIRERQQRRGSGEILAELRFKQAQDLTEKFLDKMGIK